MERAPGKSSSPITSCIWRTALIAPLALRDFEPLDEEISFGGALFPPSQENVGRFLYYEPRSAVRVSRVTR
jgi:hypothetical protein